LRDEERKDKTGQLHATWSIYRQESDSQVQLNKFKVNSSANCNIIAREKPARFLENRNLEMRPPNPHFGQFL
jgi:hypothetical protein